MIKVLATEKKRRHKIGITPLLVLACCALCLGGCGIYLQGQMAPVVESMAQSKIIALGNEIVYGSVEEVLEENNIDSDELISVEKSEDGQVRAVTSDTVTLNRVKTQVVAKVLEKFDTYATSGISFPLGSLLGWDVLSGRGPMIPIRFLPTNTISTELENSIETAGINQTRHQLVMTVHAKVGTILPGRVEQQVYDISVPVMLGETIVVGEVPDSYTHVVGDDASTIGKINDYGDNG